MLKGKHGYLSPEQARGQAVDGRSDVFSLGICLYEMLAARRLFFGSSDFSTLGLVRNAEVPPLREISPHVPEALVAITTRALARQRRDRFHSAAELREALEGFVEQSGEHCERAVLGEFVRVAASDAHIAGSDAPPANGDIGTGLLDAFDDVEPVSSVSVLAAPEPSSQPLAPLGADAFGDAADVHALEHVHPAQAPVRADPTGEDMLAELSVDEPTRVVSYESTLSGGLAAVQSDGPASDLDAAARPVRDMLPPAPHTTLPGIGMEWDDEEMSTQLYDPPESGDGSSLPLASAIPRLPSVGGTTPALRGGASSPPASVPFRPSPSFPPPSGTGAPGAHASGLAAATPGGRRTSVYPSAESSSNRPAVRSITPASSIAPQLAHTGAAVWLIAGLLALAAVGVPLALWMTRAPARGAMHLTAEPADAMVKLDGVPAGGRSSPFVLSEIIPDVAHRIEVSKPGYRTWSTRLTLIPGQIVQLPHVLLEPEASSEPLAVAAAPQPPDAPAEAFDAPAEEGAREVEPSASADEPVQARAAQRPATSDEDAPADAPAAEDEAPTVSAGWRRPVPPQPARAWMRPPAATIDSPVAQPTEETVRVAPPTPIAAPDEVQPEPAPEQGAVDGNTGLLRINSRPWSRVYVDGRMIGSTPQMGIVLGAGRHTVTLVNPDFGVQRVLTVQIKPNETLTKIVELQE
jgi:eukaryotic-like serine/threonine-protein kinase